MTPRPPARLVGYFARSAPICATIRRGSSRYSQMILWHTDKDEFTPGQWMKGSVNFATLSADGRYMAMAISDPRKRGEPYSRNICTICKPPYFTALELWIDCPWFKSVTFLHDDTIVYPGELEHIVNATETCPFARVQRSELAMPWPNGPDHCADVYACWGPATGKEQRGRSIRFEAGRALVVEGEGSRPLFDANPYEFEPIVAPDWARDW